MGELATWLILFEFQWKYFPCSLNLCTDPAEKKCMSSGTTGQQPVLSDTPSLHRLDIPRFGQSSGDLGKVDKVTRMVALW